MWWLGRLSVRQSFAGARTMLRSIRRRLLGAFATNSRRQARRRPARRLHFENLERRELLSVSGISDGSFEVPALPANTFQYAPNGSPWQFAGAAGVCANGSAFGNPAAPDGVQAAFLQGNGSMSESVYLDAGAYCFTFMAAQRSGPSQTHSQEFQVLVDGAPVGVVTPSGAAYGSYQTANFAVAAGTHTVEFIGLNPLGGDNTAFVDEVAVASTGDSISDGSFELPALAANTFQYAPSGSPWQFSAGAGVCSNGSAFGNPGAPDGMQAALLQSAGSMSESVYLDAGTYGLTFMAAQRAGQKHYQEFEVLVDGGQVGTVTPTGTTYETYETSDFTVAAGMHTIEFLDLNPLGGDNTAFVDEVAITELASSTLTQANAITDSSFEVPSLPADKFQYAPNGSPWQFSAGAGVCSNGSAFGNPPAPDGVQAAFIQSTGSMSQSVYLDAGTYNLTFLAAQRAGQKQSQEFQVLVDSAVVGTVTPTGTTYETYQTSNFTVAAGTHTIEFSGLNPQGGDNTAFVDETAVSQADLISDGSFEVPSLAADAFQYAPGGSPWQFAGGAGVCGNGSAFGNPPAPDGVQAAFLQSTGSMSQSVYLDGGTYSLSFLAAQRAGQRQSQEFEVLVDSAVVGTVTPTGATYGSYETSDFTVAAGTHTIELLGMNPQGGDNTAFVDEVAISVVALPVLTQADLVSDGSFEVPALAADAFQYAPNGSPWQFSATAGVCGNGSAFGNPVAPDGVQAAFVQGTGSMSESIYLDAGTYSLSFMAAQRAGTYQTHYQELQVLVDGGQVGTVTPTGATYGSYETSDFTVAAGTHTIELLGMNPLGGDNTAFVDEVAISTVSMSTLAQADPISDGSFEAPPLAANAFQYAPNGSPWQFAAGAGVCGNGSVFGNPVAPDGVQAAFIQGAGSMSESVYLDAGTYSLSFMAAQRTGAYQTHYQELQVLVDGAQVGVVNPGGAAYETYETSNFTVAAAAHTIELLGMNPLGGDNTAFVDEVAIAQADLIGDDGFELPALAASTFQYAPSGSPWQFSAGAGVCSNGSAFGNPNAPDGVQAAFIQGTGSVSQSVYLDAGAYGLSFPAAQRAGVNQAHYQELEVLVDGAAVGTVTPTSAAYAWYETPSFTVSAGTHTIQFLGMNPLGGDNTAFVDEVQIS
jgi:predicted RecA/RadA family phage recombinase/DNA-directed RNA polymerase subunit K/omega